MALLETTILYKGTPLKITGDNAALVSLSGEDKNVFTNIEASLTAIETNTGPLTRTPNLIRTNTSGNIAVDCYDFSVFNAGLADGVFLGAVIKPGEIFSFDAGALNNIYSAGVITYDGTGTELIITYNS